MRANCFEIEFSSSDQERAMKLRPQLDNFLRFHSPPVSLSWRGLILYPHVEYHHPDARVLVLKVNVALDFRICIPTIDRLNVGRWCTLFMRLWYLVVALEKTNKGDTILGYIWQEGMRCFFLSPWSIIHSIWFLSLQTNVVIPKIRNNSKIIENVFLNQNYITRLGT